MKRFRAFAAFILMLSAVLLSCGSFHDKTPDVIRTKREAPETSSAPSTSAETEAEPEEQTEAETQAPFSNPDSVDRIAELVRSCPTTHEMNVDVNIYDDCALLTEEERIDLQKRILDAKDRSKTDPLVVFMDEPIFDEARKQAEWLCSIFQNDGGGYGERHSVCLMYVDMKNRFLYINEYCDGNKWQLSDDELERLINSSVRDLLDEGRYYESAATFVGMLNGIMQRKPAVTPTSAAENPADASVKELDVSASGLTSLDAVSRYTNLEFLNAINNNITDLSPVSNLKRLKKLWVAGNKITDLSPLTGLENLENLGIGEMPLKDLTPVRSLKNLKVLDFWYSDVSDIRVLAELTSLEEVYMSFTKVSTLEPLMRLPNLKIVSIRGLDIPEKEITDFMRLHPNCILYRN